MDGQELVQPSTPMAVCCGVPLWSCDDGSVLTGFTVEHWQNKLLPG